ncbi:ShTK domain protein [Trichostrongylus colubriformis]|uniref:ShTK domain protein n=1 Tax=Trichostrongylus colubriformis TaxID=6319 RepID=A0AAN8IJT1_TRICO
MGVSIDGCVYAGVEIKTNKDQTLTGYRFCSPQAAGTTLRSYSNRVPIITYNRFDTSKTVLEYRHVPATSDRSKPSPVVPSETATAGPVPTTTKKPVVAPTPAVPNVKPSPSPVITGTGFKCVDASNCFSLKAQGFCDRMKLSKATVMKVCPKTCGFC